MRHEMRPAAARMYPRSRRRVSLMLNLILFCFMCDLLSHAASPVTDDCFDGAHACELACCAGVSPRHVVSAGAPAGGCIWVQVGRRQQHLCDGQIGSLRCEQAARHPYVALEPAV